MNENPQKENGHVDIANEIVEALSRTNLTAHESRFLWCLFRKTYGWQKKEDWISLSQIAEMTGLHKSHASRAKRLLVLRNMVTPRGNKIGFNKFYSQWKQLPHGVNNHGNTKNVTPRGNLPPAPRGNLGLPHGVYTKDNVTKDTITKERPEKRTTNKTESMMRELVLQEQWADTHYIDKVWSQGVLLYEKQEFLRKVNLMINWSLAKSTLGRAKLLFHEICGFVNDKSLQNSNM